jgi:cytochrome c oxidase cbb3-type subunit 1
MRTVHLTAVLYGWITNAALGIIVWLLPRAAAHAADRRDVGDAGRRADQRRHRQRHRRHRRGLDDGMEYLEIPWQIGLSSSPASSASSARCCTRWSTARSSRCMWRLVPVAALLWITLLFIVAKLPGVHTGVQQATTNWWYSHNVLGLWFTPVSVGAIYFLPKIIGRPVRSYNLSPGLLDAGLLLRPGGRPPPGGRAGAGLADHAVHRAEHDDDHPGGGLPSTWPAPCKGACTWRCTRPRCAS